MAWRQLGDKPLSEPMMVWCTDAFGFNLLAFFCSCKHYVYVDVTGHTVTRGEDGYTDSTAPTQLFPDADITAELGTTDMAHINGDQVSQEWIRGLTHWPQGILNQILGM